MNDNNYSESNHHDLPTHPKPFSPVANVAKGMGMGAADVIPGVSGGTVALIVGIYGRLIDAISRFDRTFLRLLRNRQWKEAATHVDLSFLLTLAVGIGIGFVLTLLTVFKLLTNLETRPFVLASFMGMIIASTWILWDSIPFRRNSSPLAIWIPAVMGAAISYLIATMSPASFSTDPPLWYLFVCGSIGICAMILPGISGALILLLLGVYQFLSGIAHELTQGENAIHNLTIVIVFGAGCVVGLLSFSKILRGLLARFPTPTFSFLMGLMLGSLPLLWPFQVDMTPEIEKFKEKHFLPTMPESINAHVLWICLAAFIAFVLVAGCYWFKQSRSPIAEET